MWIFLQRCCGDELTSPCYQRSSSKIKYLIWLKRQGKWGERPQPSLLQTFFSRPQDFIWPSPCVELWVCANDGTGSLRLSTTAINMHSYLCQFNLSTGRAAGRLCDACRFYQPCVPVCVWGERRVTVKVMRANVCLIRFLCNVAVKQFPRSQTVPSHGRQQNDLNLNVKRRYIYLHLSTFQYRAESDNWSRRSLSSFALQEISLLLHLWTETVTFMRCII